MSSCQCCQWQLPELCTFSFLSLSLKIIHHHPLAPLPVTPQDFHSKLKCHPLKKPYPASPDPLSSYSPLNYTCLNSYSASSDPMATIPKPSMDYPLDNSSDLMQRS